MSGTDPVAIWRGGPSLTVGTDALPTAPQLCLVRAAVGPVEGIEGALREWRSLVDLSGPVDGGSYRLLPAVYHRLQEHGIDDPNRAMLKGVYRLALVENARMWDDIAPVVAALDAAGIRLTLSKGAALVQGGYYATSAMRPMSDVDLVVDPSRRDDAIEVLRDLGFELFEKHPGLDSVHAAPFLRADGGELDLHWHFLAHARSAAADALLRRAGESVPFHGIEVDIPGPAGLLIMSAVHGFVANREPPVRWLVDAARVIDRAGDALVWDDVVTFAREFRMARRIEGALQVLTATTGREVPARTMAALAELPTAAIERVERRLAITPWDSRRARNLKVLAGYAGGDRDLRRVAIDLPRYLANRWQVDLRRVPAGAVRRLLGRARRDRA